MTKLDITCYTFNTEVAWSQLEEFTLPRYLFSQYCFHDCPCFRNTCVCYLFPNLLCLMGENDFFNLHFICPDKYTKLARDGARPRDFTLRVKYMLSYFNSKLFYIIR